MRYYKDKNGVIWEEYDYFMHKCNAREWSRYLSMKGTYIDIQRFINKEIQKGKIELISDYERFNNKYVRKVR